MNPVHHHPPEVLLVDHAAGALEAGRSLVLAAHLGVCEACRAEVERAEAVGGALLDALPPTSMDPQAVALALARIERPAPPLAAAPQSPPGWIVAPAEVVQAAQKRRRWAAPGVWVAPVIQGPGRARTYLLRVGAGMSVPRHTHKGEEMVCVLKGAFADGEALFAEGDFALSDAAIDHRPTVTGEGECVCLIATDNPLIARDWVGRLFQPLVRI